MALQYRQKSHEILMLHVPCHGSVHNDDSLFNIQLNFLMSKWSGPRNVLQQEWLEIINWALWGAKHFGKISVFKRMLTFKHSFTIIYFVHWRI